MVSKEEWSLIKQNVTKLAVSNNYEEYIQERKDTLLQRIKWVNENVQTLEGVSLLNDEIHVKRLEKNTPEEAKDYSKSIYKMLPKIKLTNLLIEVASWTKFDDQFTHASTFKSPNNDEKDIIMATLIAMGTNIGLSKMADATDDITYYQMANTAQWRLYDDALSRAQSTLVNFLHKLSLPYYWGDGSTSSSDGMRVQIGVSSLHAEHNPHYGSGKGATIYRFGVWEAIYIIDGLMKNKSDIQPYTIHGDTQAQSTPVFALTYLLGIKLMPRIRNWKDLKFYRVDKKHKYKHIDSLFSDVVDWKLIETHWKDMLQVVLSIKAGKIVPSTLLRKLNNYSHKNKLYQAFKELGRVIRTIFLLGYISDIEMRQQITSTTNKMESYNGFSKYFSFGGEGVISENDPDEQEKRIKYNNLVANAVILQNVVDMTLILKELSANGVEFTKSDVATLSPYITKHIKRFGDYVIDLENIPKAIDMSISIPMKQGKAT